jgi:hypothetical protein
LYSDLPWSCDPGNQKKTNTIWLFNIAMEHHGKSPFLIGKPSINGPFSMDGYEKYESQLG